MQVLVSLNVEPLFETSYRSESAQVGSSSRTGYRILGSVPLYTSQANSDSIPCLSSPSTHPGFALGGFFSLMSATFAYEDPLSRASEKLVGTKAQTMFIFKEMGRNMWSSGKGFAKVGALYSGYECCIEGVSPEFLRSLFVVIYQRPPR